jgi:hypothetical protein
MILSMNGRHPAPRMPRSGPGCPGLDTSAQRITDLRIKRLGVRIPPGALDADPQNRGPRGTRPWTVGEGDSRAIGPLTRTFDPNVTRRRPLRTRRRAGRAPRGTYPRRRRRRSTLWSPATRVSGCPVSGRAARQGCTAATRTSGADRGTASGRRGRGGRRSRAGPHGGHAAGSSRASCLPRRWPG